MNGIPLNNKLRYRAFLTRTYFLIRTHYRKARKACPVLATAACPEMSKLSEIKYIYSSTGKIEAYELYAHYTFCIQIKTLVNIMLDITYSLDLMAATNGGSCLVRFF